MAPSRLSRRAFLRRATLFGTSAAALGILAACGQQPASTTAPANPTTALAPAGAAAPAGAPTVMPAQGQGTLRAALDIPVKLDPAFASSDSEIAILNNVYDYLVDVDHQSKIQPRLAQSWKISADGLTYTFTLVPNVSFHDGSPLTAKDVVWTFNRLRDPQLELPTSSLYANVDTITTEGDQQVVFKLKQTNPFFLYDLSDNHAVVLKAETVDAATKFNGTGPFKVVSYSPEDRMELVANDKYFVSSKPDLSKLSFIFFKDEVAGVDALRSGQIDLTTRMPSSLFPTLQNEPNLTALSIPTNGFDLVRLRADQKPGDDPRVVKALKLATDRKAVFGSVELGQGAVGRDSPIGPLFTAYYTEDTEIPAADPEAARKLLAEAGYPNGIKLDLHVPDSGDRPDLAVVLKEQWAKAGIEVNPVVQPESIYYGDNGWLDVGLGITGWGSRPTPQFYLDVMLVTGAKWNESHFSDPEFDKLAALAGSTLDEQERVQAYRDIQRILIERGPLVIPYFFAQLGAIGKGFDGFNMKAFPGRSDLAAIRATG